VPLLPEGLWLALALCGLYAALLVMWLSSERPSVRRRAPAFFRHCDGCLAEVRTTLARCPRCGHDLS